MNQFDQSPSSTSPEPESRSRRFVVGIITVSVLFIAALGVSVYLTFDYIRRRVETTSLAIPAIADEPVYNQIAFIGNDSNLWLVSPDGTNLRPLTTDGQHYRFPTWSPDGRQIAFIGRAERGHTALYVSPANRSAPTAVYSQADSPPFYLYWAPDSQAITFLTQESANLSMRLVETNRTGSHRLLGEGAPFYWAWSPHSDRLVMHVGGSRATSAEAHISLLENRQEAERLELKLAPGRFQAPLWSADGKFFYYIAENDDGVETIFKANAQTLAQQQVTALDGFAHLALSPDNRYLAYLQLEAGASPPFGQAYLVDQDGNQVKTIMNSPVASMYWSPDGKKLALLSLARPKDEPTAKVDGLAAPLGQQFLLRWWVYHRETDQLKPVASFEPTLNFLQTIPYFDQYHLSLTFWSPDSRYLVVTKRLADQNNAGSVWVVDTSGQSDPLQVGDGVLAVWSWQ